MRISGESFFDLGGKFKGKGVEALGQVANVLEEIVVGDERGDGGEESSSGGDEGLGDTGSNGAETGGAGGAQSGEGVNDTPNGPKETDERSDPSGGGEPGHALFHAANFLGGSELHGDGDRLHGLEFLRRRVSSAGELALEFAIAGGIDGGERRTRGDESLGIGDAFRGAEDFQELIAFAADAAEEAGLLEDQSPGDERENEKKGEDEAGNPAGLRENFKDVADKECGEQRNDVNPSRKAEIW